MAGSHLHSHSHAADAIRPARGPVAVLLAFLLASAAATAVGVAMLWPDSDRVEQIREANPYAAPGVTFLQASVTDTLPPCPDERSRDESCGRVIAELDEGPEQGTEVPIEVSTALLDAGIGPGDTLRLMRIPTQDGQVPVYTFDRVVRLAPIWILGAAFVLVVGAVARLRGLLALVGLGLGGVVLFRFMLPALLSGSSGIWVALAGSAAIMFVVLYLSHGPSVRTSAALAGTLLGIAVIAGVGELGARMALLTGVADEEAAQLTVFAQDVSFHGLLMCALVVAGLGVLNDVTITQSSAVWELRAAGPTLTRRELFTSGMRIGRDHIASTIYTIVFAYAGTALAVLLLLTIYAEPALATLSRESIAEEVVRTLASGIGLVLAVPLTTAIAVLTVGPVPRRASGDGSAHEDSAHEDEVHAYQRRH